MEIELTDDDEDIWVAGTTVPRPGGTMELATAC